MDDNAEKLGRKKMRTDAMKRQFAINGVACIQSFCYAVLLKCEPSYVDFSRSQKAMASCQFCFGEHDEPPKAGVIAMGSRSYLSCSLTEELTEGHCYIVPIQHHFCMLEADDDVWDEVRVSCPSCVNPPYEGNRVLTRFIGPQNFMKCLIRMAAAAGRGVIFFETVINLKWQKHTYIECIPVPLEVFDELPAYFRVRSHCLSPFLYYHLLTLPRIGIYSCVGSGMVSA